MSVIAYSPQYFVILRPSMLGVVVTCMIVAPCSPTRALDGPARGWRRGDKRRVLEDSHLVPAEGIEPPTF